MKETKSPFDALRRKVGWWLFRLSMVVTPSPERPPESVFRIFGGDR